MAPSQILVTSLSRVIPIHYEWCLDMPSLTDVNLSSKYAFKYKTDVTKNSTYFIPFSRIDIGALSRYIWSPRGMWLLSLCHMQPLPIHHKTHSTLLERVLSLCKHGNNDDEHVKWWKFNQNGGNSKWWSFPPNRVKSTPYHITKHPHCIPIQRRIKTESLNNHQQRTAKHSQKDPISSITILTSP